MSGESDTCVTTAAIMVQCIIQMHLFDSQTELHGLMERD